MDKAEDFMVERKLSDLVRRMNALSGDDLIDLRALEAQIVARDREIANPYAKDGQVTASTARANTGPTGSPAWPRRTGSWIPPPGPSIAVRLWILTRKSLGGLQTDLDSRVLQPSGQPLEGLYAAGEVAGFGGGGMHGYRALEGTFLGGCLFSGRTAGRAVADAADLGQRAPVGIGAPGVGGGAPGVAGAIGSPAPAVRTSPQPHSRLIRSASGEGAGSDT